MPTLVASDPVVPEDEHATTLADRAGGRSGTQTGAKQSKRLSCRCTASRTAAESGRAPEKHPEAWRQRTQSAPEADDVERSRVELNRRAREEAGTARQPRGGGFEDLLVGEPTVIDKLKGEMILKKR